MSATIELEQVIAQKDEDLLNNSLELGTVSQHLRELEKVQQESEVERQ